MKNSPQCPFTPKASTLLSPAWLLLLCAVALVGCTTGRRVDTAGRTGLKPGFIDLQNAVVRIDVRAASYDAGALRSVRGVGSGVVVSEDGLILTNAHVVNPKAEEIVVTLANLERVDAQLLGWDHWTDLALIQLDMDEVRERKLDFSVAQFGDSTQLLPGQGVFAVGTPNGLTRTVTRGIISNTNRYFAASDMIDGYETGYFNTWLQTDAAINPGNSGGPLVTEDGLVIGINTRSYLGANNLSFAVPSATAKEVMAKLSEGKDIARSHLGFHPAPLQDLENFFNLDANQGMLIDHVDLGSPAAEAGLRAGDIVLAINGKPVDGRYPEQLPALLNSIAVLPVGTPVSLDIRRGRENSTLHATTEKLQSRMGEQYAFQEWGLSVQKVSRAIARENRWKNDEGFLVMGALPAFPASLSGLQRGDVILKVNRTPIATLDELKQVYDEYTKNPDRVLIEVNRNHQVSFFILKP